MTNLRPSGTPNSIFSNWSAIKVCGDLLPGCNLVCSSLYLYNYTNVNKEQRTNKPLKY